MLAVIIPGSPNVGGSIRCPHPLFTLAIDEGKRKSLLLIDTSIDMGFDVTANVVRVRVNGIYAQPDLGILNHCPAADCTSGGTFVFDIDAEPSLIGVPLTVEVIFRA